MNFEDEPYVRLYTTDTASWALLGWEGQTVLMHMLRGRFDRAGVFDCGRHDPSHAVTAVTRLPAEIVAVGLAALLAEGAWVLSGQQLVWPNYVHAQTCARSDRARQAESRKNRRNSALAVITPESRNVTGSHDPSQASRNVTLSSSSPSLTEQSRAEGESALPPVSETKVRAAAPVLSAGQRQALSLQQAQPEDVAILEAWRDRFKKPDVVFTADRAVTIAERRAEGMTQTDALDALVGAEADDWFMRQGAKLSLVFNNQERFETFRDVGRAIREGRAPVRRSKGAPAPRQPDSGYSPSAHAKEIL